MTDMTTAGAPAADDDGREKTPDNRAHNEPMKPDFAAFLADARRRRAESSVRDSGRPHDWVEPDPAALAGRTGRRHPLDRATARRKAGKSRDIFAGRCRLAAARLHALDPSKPADPMRYPWHHLDVDTAVAFRAAVYADYTNQSTRNDYVVAVRALIAECYKLKLISAMRRDELLDALYTITPPRSSRGRRLSYEEISALLEACATVGTPGARARNIAIVCLFVTTGMRVSELVNIELADWNRDADVIRLRDTKNGSHHDTFLHPEMPGLLHRWLAVRGEAPGALFTPATRPEIRAIGTFSVLYMIQHRAAAAGLKEFGCHDFRRTFASTLLRTHDPALVSKLLNHKKLSSTLIYDLTSDDEQRDAVATIDLPSLDVEKTPGDEPQEGDAA